MSRLCLGIVSLACLVLVRAEARADLRWEAPAADAGEVRAGRPLSREFRYVNDGAEAVELVAAQPSCGCLTPRLGRRLVRPGEGGAVVLEVHTLGQPAGAHSWQLRLQYRQGTALQEVLLRLNARVVTEITVQPAALTFFAQGPLSQEVVLTDTRARPLEVRELRTSSPHLRASLAEGKREGAGPRAFRITLEALADFPTGHHDEVLSIYTDDPLYPHLAVQVTVVRSPGRRLAVTPEEVTAAAAPGQALPARLLLVRDSRDEPVVVEGVTSDDPAIQCRWAPGPDHRTTVRVQVDRARLGGPVLRSAVHIHVARPVRETLTVPVRCTLE